MHFLLFLVMFVSYDGYCFCEQRGLCFWMNLNILSKSVKILSSSVESLSNSVTFLKSARILSKSAKILSKLVHFFKKEKSAKVLSNSVNSLSNPTEICSNLAKILLKSVIFFKSRPKVCQNIYSIKIRIFVLILSKFFRPFQKSSQNLHNSHRKFSPHLNQPTSNQKPSQGLKLITYLSTVRHIVVHSNRKNFIHFFL